MQDRVAAYPLLGIQWLPNQDRFLRDPSRKKLIRQGNQWGGKTTAAIQEVHWRCTGTHPHYPTPPPPIEVWVVCASFSQSLAIQEKFWNLIDRDTLDPATSYCKRNGFKGKEKAIQYQNGSLIRFRTTNQDTLNLAGATIDVVMIDEPTSQRTYTELSRRVARRGGVVLFSLTPINGPVDYLRELVERGAVADHHARCEPQELVPVGSSRPLHTSDGVAMDAAWIAEQVADVPDSEVPVVIHGQWETRDTKRQLAAFNYDKHVIPIDGDPAASLRAGWVEGVPVRIMLQADHGKLAYHAVWQVMAYQILKDKRGRVAPKMRIVGEYLNPPGASEQDDVRAVARLLERLGVSLEWVHVAVGDHNSARASARGSGTRKLNTIYTELFADHMGLPRAHPSFAVRNSRKGARSVDLGVRVINNALKRGNLQITTDCPITIQAWQRWAGKDDDHKHPCDATRYGVVYATDLAISEAQNGRILRD